MRRLLLLRHAPTAATRRAAFSTDESLDERGAVEASALRDRLPAADEWLSSPAARAQETARILGLAPRADPLLAECDFGAWAGRELEEVARADPEGVRRWLADPAASPHGGESLTGVLRRVGGWLDAQARLEGTVLAVTHAGPIRASVIHALGAPPEAFWRVDAAPLSLTELHADGGDWRLVHLNVVNL